MLAGIASLALFATIIVDLATSRLIPVFGFPYSDLGRTIYIAVLMSTLWGLVGLHAHLEGRYGWLGTSGFLAAYVGDTLALVGLGLTWLFRGNILGQEPAITLGLSGMVVGRLLLGLGFLVWGVATFRTGALPKSYGLALVVAFVVVLDSIVFPASLGSYAVTLVLGLVWLALGSLLWKARDRSPSYQ